MKTVIENAEVEINHLNKEIEELERRVESKRKTRDKLIEFVKQNSECVSCRLCGKVVPYMNSVRVVVRIDQPTVKLRTFCVCETCIDKLVE